MNKTMQAAARATALCDLAANIETMLGFRFDVACERIHTIDDTRAWSTTHRQAASLCRHFAGR